MMSFIAQFFAPKPSKKQETNKVIPTLEKLTESLECLEKREKILLKKVAQEVSQARELSKERNKRAAIQCLKRKRLYEQQIEQLGNFQLRIHDQMIMLEAAQDTMDTVDALKSGSLAMKNMQKFTNIDDVDKTLDEINAQSEDMKQVQDALSQPIIGFDFDEDELEAELDELEELEEAAELEDQLLKPATWVPTDPVKSKEGKKVEDDVSELAELQKELAL